MMEKTKVSVLFTDKRRAPSYSLFHEIKNNKSVIFNTADKIKVHTYQVSGKLKRNYAFAFFSSKGSDSIYNN